MVNIIPLENPTASWSTKKHSFCS